MVDRSDVVRCERRGGGGAAAGAIIDGDRRIDKIAVGIRVADAQLSELAGTAADRVLVTVGASPRVEDRSKPGIDVVSQFVNLLIEGEVVAGRFREPVANPTSPIRVLLRI